MKHDDGTDSGVVVAAFATLTKALGFDLTEGLDGVLTALSAATHACPGLSLGLERGLGALVEAFEPALEVKHFWHVRVDLDGGGAHGAEGDPVVVGHPDIFDGHNWMSEQ